MELKSNPPKAKTPVKYVSENLDFVPLKAKAKANLYSKFRDVGDSAAVTSSLEQRVCKSDAKPQKIGKHHISKSSASNDPVFSSGSFGSLGSFSSFGSKLLSYGEMSEITLVKCGFCGKEVKKSIEKDHVEAHPTKILDWLYLGSYENAKSMEEIKLTDTKYVLNCALECKNVFQDELSYKKITMTDSPNTNLFDYLNDALDFVREAELAKSNILIHCQVGKSRSASIVIAYLMKYYGYSLDGAFRYIKNLRGKVLPNIGFMMQLREYEKDLQEKEKEKEKEEEKDKEKKKRAIERIVTNSTCTGKTTSK